MLNDDVIRKTQNFDVSELEQTVKTRYDSNSEKVYSETIIVGQVLTIFYLC
jgi:hypothetical protein